MSQPGYERSEEQILQERAMGHVSDTLLTLEHALDQARKGLKVVRKDGVNVNAELALTDLVKDLERLRKRFTQDTYYAVDSRVI